jgi:uncharacterized protein YbjT (DUF2867 family)
MSTILVIGATGTVGRPLVSELLTAGVNVRALLRKPASAELSAAVERVPGDLAAPETLDLALRNVDAVFLVWAAGPATGPAVIDRIARSVPRLVLLTAPHQTPHPFFQQPNPLSAKLAGIERHVEATPLQWTFVRPGMFAANCIHWWGAAFRNDEVVRWPLLEAPTAPIDPLDVAAVAARVLTDAKTSHAGKSYVVTGPQSLTQRQQLQIIADTLGRPLRCEDLTAEQARRLLAATFPLPALDMLLGAWTAALGQPAYLTTTVTDLLGRSAHSFHDWARRNAVAFSPRRAEPTG